MLQSAWVGDGHGRMGGGVDMIDWSEVWGGVAYPSCRTFYAPGYAGGGVRSTRGFAPRGEGDLDFL